MHDARLTIARYFQGKFRIIKAKQELERLREEKIKLLFTKKNRRGRRGQAASKVKDFIQENFVKDDVLKDTYKII